MLDTDSGKIQYITQAGVIFITLLFTMSVYFYVVSPFVDSFFTTYNTLQVGDATDEVAYYGPLLYTAVKIILALGIVMPIVWFIFWCLHKHPSTQRRRYF